MKEQYIGDVNDYRKYALLRALAAGSNLSLGICWMLTGPDGRPDGNKVGYLLEPATWRHHDPKVFDLLGVIAGSPDSRRLTAIEQSGLFPQTRFSSAHLADDLKSRTRYFHQAHEDLAACDLVFFDPDNGLDVPSVQRGKRNSSKYLYTEEVASFWARGSSVLFYQHYPFENRDIFAARISNLLTQVLPGSYVVVFRTAHVAFFLVSQPMHRNAFNATATAMVASWPASFIRVDEQRGSALSNSLPPIIAFNPSPGQNLPFVPEHRAETVSVMARTKTDDVCEARRLSGTDWEVLCIDEALAQRNFISMRCIECKGEVRPHRGARNGIFRPHFEHRVRHAGCSRCNRARGPQTPHPSPAS